MQITLLPLFISQFYIFTFSYFTISYKFLNDYLIEFYKIKINSLKNFIEFCKNLINSFENFITSFDFIEKILLFNEFLLFNWRSFIERLFSCNLFSPKKGWDGNKFTKDVPLLSENYKFLWYFAQCRLFHKSDNRKTIFK